MPGAVGGMSMDIKVLVVTHKDYWMPDDAMYKPIWVGNKDHVPDGFLRDDVGENIAEKNPYYCELTALYWAWKNVDAEYIGLVHYRRHFARRSLARDKRQRVMQKADMEALLQKAPILLPKPRHYWIETNWSQYAHAHHEKDLEALRRVVARREPAYLQAFDKVMGRTWGHRFNMMVMRKDLFAAYCEWLFGILGEVEGEVDVEGYDAYNRRVFGFLGERLMDVWGEGNAFREVRYLFLEKQNKWLKGVRFLSRKLSCRGDSFRRRAG